MAIDIVARALAVSGKQNLSNYYTKTESDAKYSQATNLANGTSEVLVQTTDSNHSFKVMTDGRAKVKSAPTEDDDVVRRLELDKKLDKTGGTITGSLTISQDLIVNGTTSTVDTQNLKVADKLIYVAKDNTVALISPAGLITPKYDGTNNGGIVYDSTGTAFVGDIVLDSSGNVDVANSDLQPIATRDPYSNFTNGHKVKAEVDSSQKSVKFVDGGKDDGINSLTDVNLTLGNTTVQYDTTNGIQINSVARFTGADGNHDATMDLDLPVVGKDGIVIEKAADSEKIEVSGKKFVKSVADTLDGYRVYVVSAHKDITVPLSETPMTYGVAQYNRGGILKTKNPNEDLDAANKKYVDDAIGKVFSVTIYEAGE